jgi:glycine betaine/proline transport system substrate-binding protein
MENELMDDILNKNEKPAQAAKTWLQKHPKVLDSWLNNVSTIDGKDGVQAVKQYIDL